MILHQESLQHHSGGEILHCKVPPSAILQIYEAGDIFLKFDLRLIDIFPYHALDQLIEQTLSPFYEALDKQP